MKEDLVYANGHLKKSYDTVSCKFRGPWIECPRGDIKAGMCDRCGWNPMVEAERIARLKK